MFHRRIFAAASGTVLVALMAVALATGTGRPARALTNCDTTEAGITAPEQTMLGLINDARAAAGLGALRLSPNLDRAAAWKSADSSASGPGFDHTDSLGRSINTRFPDCGYSITGVYSGENVAYGSTSPSTIFGMWMDSAGHKANILNSRYTVIGIGMHNGAWTTDFGSRDDSGDIALPPPSPSATPTIATPAPATASPTPATTTPTASPTPSATPSPTPTATPTPRPATLGFRATVPQLTHD